MPAIALSKPNAASSQNALRRWLGCAIALLCCLLISSFALTSTSAHALTVPCGSGETYNATLGVCQPSLSSGNSAEQCDDTSKGSIGEAIKSAVQIHSEFAVVQPHIDEIFERSADCFRGATTIFDMSPAIPSLMDIINAAIDAIKKYAIQTICNIASKIKEKITGPINDVITTINNLGKTGDINIANLTSSLFTGSTAQNVLGGLSWAGSGKQQTGTRCINTNGLGLATRVTKPKQGCSAEELEARRKKAEEELAKLDPLVKEAEAEKIRTHQALTQCQQTAGLTGSGANACKTQLAAYNKAFDNYKRLKEQQDYWNDELIGANCSGSSDVEEITTEDVCNPNYTPKVYTPELAKSGVQIMPTPQVQPVSPTKTTNQATPSSAKQQKSSSKSNSLLNSMGSLLSGGGQ